MAIETRLSRIIDKEAHLRQSILYDRFLVKYYRLCSKFITIMSNQSQFYLIDMSFSTIAVK